MTAMCLGMLAVRLCLLRSSSARIVDLFLIGVTFAQARWLGVMVTKETRCVNTTLESYENLANHWRTVLGFDVEPWRLLAVELLRLDRPIVSASYLEGIAAIKDVVLNGVCGADARQNLDAGGEADGDISVGDESSSLSSDGSPFACGGY